MLSDKAWLNKWLLVESCTMKTARAAASFLKLLGSHSYTGCFWSYWLREKSLEENYQRWIFVRSVLRGWPLCHCKFVQRSVFTITCGIFWKYFNHMNKFVWRDVVGSGDDNDLQINYEGRSKILYMKIAVCYRADTESPPDCCY